MANSQVTPAALFALEPEALKCPHIAIDALRSEGPVTWHDGMGAFVVTGFAEVMEVLRQPELFSTRFAGGRDARSPMKPVLLKADPPEHTRQRALVSRAFTSGQVRRLGDYITELTDRLIDDLIDETTVEIVERFAVPLPMTVIARFLGVDDADIPTFKRWSTDITLFVGNPNPTTQQMQEFAASSAEFSDYFRKLIDERRGGDGDDLVSKVVNAEIDGDSLSEEEMLTILRQILAAGNDTTTNLIGASLLLMAQDPQLYRRVRDEEGFAEKFIEEVLRLESPIQGLNRTALADTTVGGVAIPADSQVLLLYSGANRDPEEFEDPGELRIDRESGKSHVAFGFGTHFCIGAPLARSEARIALQRFTSRIASIELAPSAEVRYEPSYLLRGLERLDLVIQPA